MIGYWDGWADLKLGDVSANYDVVMLSFATGSGTDSATMTFSESCEPESQLVADVAKLRAHGVKVLISIGGGGGPHTELLTDTDRKNFVTSLEKIVDHYHLDGVDLDLEDGIFAVDQGDNDIFHPTTPNIVNLIKAMHELHDHYGANFMVTAPAESEAMNGYGYWGNKYGPDWTGAYGGFLSFLNGTRDILTFVAPQYYNAAVYYGLDNSRYHPGDRDFDVSQADLILNGYTLITGQYFPPVKPSQFAIGVPATGIGDDSFLDPSNVLQAAEYIGSGVSYGGKYRLSKLDGYRDWGGVMTWDINGDAGQDYALANTLAPYLHSVTQKSSTIVDCFDDFEFASKHTGGWTAKRNLGPAVDNDPSVLVRNSTAPASLVYHFNGIIGFNLRAYAAKRIGDISISASPDGSTWSIVPLTVGVKSPTVGEMGRYNIIPAAALPSGTNYLKINAADTAFVPTDPALAQLAVTYTGRAPTGIRAPSTPTSVAAAPRDGAVTLTWRPVSGATSYEIYRAWQPDRLIGAIVTGATDSSFVDYGLIPGKQYEYSVVAVGPGGASKPSTRATSPCVLEQPHSTAPAAVPGEILAADFDRGGPNIAYSSDVKPSGQKAIRLGRFGWTNYTVDAEAIGPYDVALRASSKAGATLHLRALNGLPLSADIKIPAGDWTTIDTTATLTAGRQIIQLGVDSGDATIESLRFTDQKPLAPASLSAGGSPKHGINLYWSPSAVGAVSYSLFRGTAPGQEDYTHPLATGIDWKMANGGCVYRDPEPTIGHTYYYTVVAVNSSGSSLPSKEASITLEPPSPYAGTPWPVPGVIDVDNYNKGGQGTGYNVDTRSNQGHEYRNDQVGIEKCTDDDKIGNGYDVGWLNGGDWFDYTVDVAQSGPYTVTFRISAPSPGSQLHLQDASGTSLTGMVVLPGTGGWQNWRSVTVPVTLTAGKQDLYLYTDSSGFNVEYMQIAPSTPSTTQAAKAR